MHKPSKKCQKYLRMQIARSRCFDSGRRQSLFFPRMSCDGLLGHNLTRLRSCWWLADFLQRVETLTAAGGWTNPETRQRICASSYDRMPQTLQLKQRACTTIAVTASTEPETTEQCIDKPSSNGVAEPREVNQELHLHQK